MSRSNRQPNEPIRDWSHKMRFGKYSGESLKDIFENDPDYLKWLHENTDFELHAELLEQLENKFRPVDWYDVYQLQDKGLIPKA